MYGSYQIHLLDSVSVRAQHSFIFSAMRLTFSIWWPAMEEDAIQKKFFSVADYVVFVLVLVISAGIGIYYSCTGGKQKTTGEFLMADRQMSILPVTLSMVASFMSAIMLLGTPAEMYIYGTEYMIIFVAYIMVAPVAAYLYTPVFYRLRLTSAYEVMSSFSSAWLIILCNDISSQC